MATPGDTHPQRGASPADEDVSGQSARPGPAALPAAAGPRPRLAAAQAQVGRLIRAIRDNDFAVVEDAVLRLSASRRVFAPLALAVGAFAMLFEGVKLLFTNWRLTLIQVLPAMWIWVTMLYLKYHLKAHLLHGKGFYVLRGPVIIPIVLGIAAITAASFFLNAVFAFAIASPGRPAIRPAFTQARSHLSVVLGSGAAVGVCLGVSAMVSPRWGLWWFALSLSIVIGVMMVCYVAVPARLIGMKTTYSRRDKLTASVVGGAIGAVVCTPPYVLGRIGLIMLGSRALLVPGIILIVIGLTLQAGATGAVKAIKMSAKLVSGRQQAAVAGRDPADSPP